MATMLVGHGLDAHRLIERRPLVLGGVPIDRAPRGADAHSDGDVVLHALSDAVLSAVGAGDIGDLFPPEDPVWQGLDSRRILEVALRTASNAGARPVNVVVVVTIDAPPKLGPYRDAMRGSIAELLGVEHERVGVTFKTSEGLASDHVQASAVVLFDTG
jgi:2-C-methyl-D-erythritol 2,4-cyclodiphosphate synthase